MAFDFDTATEEEILIELAKHTLTRQRLLYLLAIEELTTIGQENSDGDKTHVAARLDYLQKGLANVNGQIAQKEASTRCPMSDCEVTFV